MLPNLKEYLNGFKIFDDDVICAEKRGPEKQVELFLHN